MEPSPSSHPSSVPLPVNVNGCSSTPSFMQHQQHNNNHPPFASPLTTEASTVAHSPPLLVLRGPCSQGGAYSSSHGSCSSPLLSAGVKRKEVGGSRGGGSCMPSSLNVARARTHPHLSRPQPLQLNLLNEQHHYMHMHMHAHNTSPSLLPPHPQAQANANPHARLQHLLLGGSTGHGGGSSGPGSPWSSGVVPPPVPPLTQSQLVQDFASLLALHSSGGPVPPPPHHHPCPASPLPPPAPGTTVATGQPLDPLDRSQRAASLRGAHQWGGHNNHHNNLTDGAIVVSPLTSPTVSEASWSSCPSPLAQPLASDSLESQGIGLGCGALPHLPHAHGPWCKGKGGCKASVMESHERKRQRIDSGGPMHQRTGSGGGLGLGGEEGMDMIFSTFSGMTMAEHDNAMDQRHTQQRLQQMQQQPHSPPHRFGANLSGGQIVAMLLSKATGHGNGHGNGPLWPTTEQQQQQQQGEQGEGEEEDTKATASSAMHPFHYQAQR